ncbi:aldehyde dehydrogenase family protein [Gemmobacter nectariphilus]|uniref:aldehyde dehydrogenase family protein n=1 Tax=Gemmobacter nectariphilus TaxID=220343 RepID=UPI000410E35C|nr:aldehyde dehydrogenase family protein [Gemmobacter nectariphilus]
MTAELPRVTYSNINADFTAVHSLFDGVLDDTRAQVLGRDHAHLIGGQPVASGTMTTVVSPIDRDIVIGCFGVADAALVDRAVQAARAAQPDWVARPWQDRVAILRRFADELSRRKFTLAAACLFEVGKSRMEAIGEAEEAVDLVRYYCDQMEENCGFVRQMKRAFDNEETIDRLRPLGVFAVIAPFNFPLALSANMVSAAMVAGNAVVYKPSDRAGLTGALLAEAAQAAAIPDGVLNMITGDGATGRALARHAAIDGIAFTGSHAVGMGLLRDVAAGPFNRPVIAEMGGKNPTYVTASADLDVAAAGMARSAFGLQGQKCSAGSRVFVASAVYDDFIARLIDRARAVRIGNPADATVFMGPLIDDKALARYIEACDTARRDGRLLFGGKQLTGGIHDRGRYVQPAIIDTLPDDHPLHRDELFLPFLTVQRFDDLAEAIARGNAVDYGLTAGIYTRDPADLALFTDRAEAGVLYANRASGATTGAWPGIQTFCGWKGSGVSSKGGLGPYYLQQFLREQSLTLWHE